MCKILKKYFLENQNTKNVFELACKLSGKLQAGDIIFLRGPVGSGKTYFARHFILETLKSQNLVDEVPSPSFSLIQIYDIMVPKICHVDLYRLTYSSELEELGLENLYETSVTLIEWPERLEKRLPSRFFEIEFSFIRRNEDKRDLSFIFSGPNWDYIVGLFNGEEEF